MHVEQPPGFEAPKFPNHVFKLLKALYCLKQAPRIWYERISIFLVEKGFCKEKVDTTLFIKRKDKDLLLVQMQGEFEMSMIGELNFFLGLQIKQRKDDIFINQAKYTKKCSRILEWTLSNYKLYLTTSRTDIMFSAFLYSRFQSCPKESHLQTLKRIFRCLKDISNLDLWYPRYSSISLNAFSDANFGECKLDKKSSFGTYKFLGNMLISWLSKKQIVLHCPPPKRPIFLSVVVVLKFYE